MSTLSAYLTLLWPLAICGLALLVTLVTRQVVLSWVRRTAIGELVFASVFLRAVRIPSLLWCFAIALAVALQFSDLTPAHRHLAAVLLVSFLIVSFTMAAGSVAVRTITAYGVRHSMPFAVAGLTRVLTRVVIFSLGGMILLHYLGISVTPLLTALGVGGLAVALALQDTLANLFAGIHILVERPISVGDAIQLSSGEEGTVTDIGWRTTRVLGRGDNVIVIPNTKITSGILTNYSLPQQRTATEVVIVAGHEADPNQIANLCLDVALNTPGVLHSPAPILLFDPGVTPTHLQFKMVVHVNSYLERGLVKSALRVRIFETFRRSNIPMPAPERMVAGRF